MIPFSSFFQPYSSILVLFALLVWGVVSRGALRKSNLFLVVPIGLWIVELSGAVRHWNSGLWMVTILTVTFLGILMWVLSDADRHIR